MDVAEPITRDKVSYVPISGELEELLHRMLNNAEQREKTHRLLDRRWAVVHNVLGLPAAALAAVAGAAALASTTTRIAAGIIALVSAALTATNAFLDSSARQKDHRMQTAGWSDLHRQVQLLQAFDLRPYETPDFDPAVFLADLKARVQRLVETERMLCAGIAPALASDATARGPVAAERSRDQRHQA